MSVAAGIASASCNSPPSYTLIYRSPARRLIHTVLAVFAGVCSSGVVNRALSPSFSSTWGGSFRALATMSSPSSSLMETQWAGRPAA